MYSVHEAENLRPNEFTNNVDRPLTGTITNRSLK